MTDKQVHVFEKLTPTASNELGIYEEALDYVFQSNNEDVRNIALTGAYGAGKSSVLSSYKSKHKEKEFLHISLAHFTEQAEGESETKTVKESVLEVKILNQLIHQIPSGKIPQTHFKVKKAMGWKKAILRTLLALLFLLSTIVFIYFGKWISFISTLGSELKSVFEWSTSYNFRFVLGVMVVSFASVFIFQIVKAQKARNLLRKLSVQGNEIEMNTEEDDSFFDKYLNEVLYLFENVDADVIVFEDIDRFDTSRIFERLREINTLANLQRKKEGKGVLRFFYLLRDDIFDTKDRTKFFDYIIPIVPVVDSSNSYDQFIMHLKKNGLYEKFDERFLQGLSIYVDDMRLLKNICNEFLVYYTRLNTTELDYNKMLAIITYKNLFPSDYNDLQYKKGFVYALFNHKSDFLEDRRAAIQEEIQELELSIDNANSEMLESIQELDDVYAGKQTRNPGYWPESRAYDQRIQEWYTNEYPKRKEAIERKTQGTIKELEQKIVELKTELQRIEAMPICEIIDRNNIDRIFSLETKNEIGETEEYKGIKRNEYFDLLKYLIRNGYIDESYSDYMTYFYEDSLSRVDKVFLRSITDKKAREYSYAITDPKKILERLSPLDFDQEETLNYMLTEYLVCYVPDSEYLVHLLDQIKKAKNYAFIEEFGEITKNKEKWIPVLNQRWPELFSEVVIRKKMSSIHIREFSIETLYYCSDEIIKQMNQDDMLSNYISESSDYLRIDNPNIERIVHGFALLDIHFSEINYNDSNPDLFKAVYENGNYVLNYSNILLILKECYGFSIENVRHKMTSMIMSGPTSPLSKKVNENIKNYMEIVLDNCGGIIQDDESVAIAVLNNEAIGEEQREKYIKYLRTDLTEVSSVNNKHLQKLIALNGRMKFSTKNVCDYYLIENGLDDTIVAFVNQSDELLDFKELDASYDVYKGKLLNTFAGCNKLENRQYESAVVSLGLCFNRFSIEGIETSKVKILIKNDLIIMNEETLVFFREYYATLLPFFIEANIDSYLRLIEDDEDLFSENELLIVLTLNIDDEKKIKLLDYFSEPVSIIGKGYSIRVQEHILRNNLNDGDLNALYQDYYGNDPEIRKIIFEFAKSDIERLIRMLSNVDEKLRDKIIQSEDVDINARVKLLIANFGNMEHDSISQNLKAVGKNEFNRLFEPSSRPRFPDTEENRALLHAFEQSEWIDDFYSEDGFLKVHRQEAKKKLLAHN